MVEKIRPKLNDQPITFQPFPFDTPMGLNRSVFNLIEAGKTVNEVVDSASSVAKSVGKFGAHVGVAIGAGLTTVAIGTVLLVTLPAWAALAATAASGLALGMGAEAGAQIFIDGEKYLKWGSLWGFGILNAVTGGAGAVVAGSARTGIVVGEGVLEGAKWIMASGMTGRAAVAQRAVVNVGQGVVYRGFASLGEEDYFSTVWGPGNVLKDLLFGELVYRGISKIAGRGPVAKTEKAERPRPELEPPSIMAELSRRAISGEKKAILDVISLARSRTINRNTSYARGLLRGLVHEVPDSFDSEAVSRMLPNRGDSVFGWCLIELYKRSPSAFGEVHLEGLATWAELDPTFLEILRSMTWGKPVLAQKVARVFIRQGSRALNEWITLTQGFGMAKDDILQILQRLKESIAAQEGQAVREQRAEIDNLWVALDQLSFFRYEEFNAAIVTGVLQLGAFYQRAAAQIIRALLPENPGAFELGHMPLLSRLSSDLSEGLGPQIWNLLGEHRPDLMQFYGAGFDGVPITEPNRQPSVVGWRLAGAKGDWLEGVTIPYTDQYRRDADKLAREAKRMLLAGEIGRIPEATYDLVGEPVVIVGRGDHRFNVVSVDTQGKTAILDDGRGNLLSRSIDSLRLASAVPEYVQAKLLN